MSIKKKKRMRGIKKTGIIAESRIKRQVDLLRIAIHNIKTNAEITASLFCSSYVKDIEKAVDEIEKVLRYKDRIKLSPVKIYKYVYSPIREDGTWPDPYSRDTSNEVRPNVIFDDPDYLRIYLMGFPHEKMYL
jgi:hypothetical protein